MESKKAVGGMPTALSAWVPSKGIREGAYCPAVCPGAPACCWTWNTGIA